MGGTLEDKLRIGFYKPTKKILFFDDEGEDKAGWSTEISQMIHVLEEHSNADVSIWSDTDNVQYKPKTRDACDILFVYNGKFNEPDYSYIKNFDAKFKVLCITDMDLIPRADFVKTFDVVLSQSTTNKATKLEKETYYPFESLICVNKDINTENKVLWYFFAGGERNRLEKLLDYVWRPDCHYVGKAKSIGHDNRIPFKTVMNYLRSAKYSIVFADPTYEEANFLTQRYWECLTNDVVAFVDNDYDKETSLVAMDDYRRVNDYRDLRRKMLELDLHRDVLNDILEKQRLEVSKWSSGARHFNLLSDIIESYGGPRLCLKKQSYATLT